MSATRTSTTPIVRVTVQSEGRRLDVTVPRQVPLIEIMPGFARSLGVLDPTMTSSGYVLQAADGTPLDPARTLADLDISDGDVLSLSRGAFVATPRVYDDIVEAVLDVTGEQRGWSARDNARTALAVSLAFLAVCAVLLLPSGRGVTLNIIVAVIGAIVLLATTAFLARLRQPESGAAMGVAAAAFGAVAGYLAVPADANLWGWPLAAAGAGAVVVGAAALALSPHRPVVQYVPIVTGAAVALPALSAGLLPTAATSSYTMMIAVAGALANALPWLALSTTQLRVISPMTDAEIFADAPVIDGGDVQRRASAGHRSLTALRTALGLAMLAATPVVAADNPWSVLLCALAFAGLMFPARMSYSRAHVLVLLALGSAGIALTCLVGALTQPALVPVIVTALAATAAATIVLTLLAPGARLRLARLSDTIEIIVLALVLPVGLVASGLLGS
ncbi:MULTISPECIES: type VII secretion integral membrane protein EccD [Microbacterium]|uniref:type VII secretion integral membrane protein EccD n=1 Tax=Microbacterium TaxID=33882 RepID=UPI001E2E58BD|nr:type VII secretion integral membrane protein EccD [Microbacterium nymphoidis]MCD2498698.1 type VII secretion integral membrane protein EccD [Microbacterium nymphoidis]